MNPNPRLLAQSTATRAPVRGPARVDGHWDAVVVGAGFGGLGAALAMAEGGARVLVCETLTYPGGCASTFERGGQRFEAGATLFSGLAPDELFGRWIARHALPVEIEWLDPLVQFRAPSFKLSVGRDRGAFRARLAALCASDGDATRTGLERFFALQERVADLGWELFRDPSSLPPLDASAIARHALRLPRHARAAATIASLVGRPLSALVARCGLARCAPFGLWLDATCQITLQARADEVEAAFALCALDYYWRGTGHVRGGIGELAQGLVAAIRGSGGEVAFACGVRGIARARGEAAGRWAVTTRRGVALADAVLANVLPQSLATLVPERDLGSRARTRLARRGRAVESGWGACMLYRVVRATEGPARASEGAEHLQLVLDGGAPLVEGNHVFASLASAADRGRSPAGTRTLTASTHVPLAELRALPPAARAERVAAIQAAMRRTLAARAPEWEAVATELPASPRTFERFTSRFAGYVGGVPRRAGREAYRGLFDGPLERGLHLVGDSVFPGQSTLAAALGGVRAAERVRRGG